MANAPTATIPKEEDENVLLRSLRAIAQGSDCWGREEDGSCSCPVCEANFALAKVNNWRFEAAVSERVTNGFHPAEARMIEAWRRYMKRDPDALLAQVLKLDGQWDITRRDWYVATSVVQWLATNIGSVIIEQAGYQYLKYDEDRACRDSKLPPTLGETSCDACAAETGTGRRFCGHCGRHLHHTTAVAP